MIELIFLTMIIWTNYLSKFSFYRLSHAQITGHDMTEFRKLNLYPDIVQCQLQKYVSHPERSIGCPLPRLYILFTCDKEFTKWQWDMQNASLHEKKNKETLHFIVKWIPTLKTYFNQDKWCIGTIHVSPAAFSMT